MDSKELEKSIKEIIKPHFGHLHMYKKWYNNKDMSFDDIEEFHVYLKTHKNIIQKLSKPLNNYKSYYKAMLEISKVEKDEELKRLFKNGLNGSSRKFFRDTYNKYKRTYLRLSKNEFKLRVFFRNSSKPHTLNDYLLHLKRSLTFANDMLDLIKDIETNYDYIRTNNGAYLFELTSNILHIVPNSWCIYKSESEFIREKTSRDLNSIWLLIDPCETIDERKIVGIDVPNGSNDLLYMNTLNNRFTDDVPIGSNEFFRIAKHRLGNNKPNQEEVSKAISEHLERLKEQAEKDALERLKLEEKQGKTLLGRFFDSKY
tara:strand:- start:10668 stop:11612 length:945 start_codon:yes stop_codon:yes gene_type:complete